MIKESNVTSGMQNEVAILQQLRAFDADRFNFVQFNDSFSDKEHIYLEFEKLDMSLHEFVVRKPSCSLSVKEIRPILHQMATTLQLLKSQGIVHTDLKPDNIMMVDSVNKPLKIKLIDFGLAFHVSQSEFLTYLQPRHYRSPEVILGNPSTTAIDMWSLGCIAAELFLGFVLYPGNCEYDMLRHVMHTQGRLPLKLLNDGPKTTHFFQRRKFRRKCWWRLKTSVEYGQESITETYFKSLDDLKKMRPACHLSDEDNMAEIEDQENFVDLLKRMLHLDVDKRITPGQLLEDPFITMNDLAERYPNSFYVKLCCERMEVCQHQSQSPDDQDQQQLIDLPASTSNASLDQNVSYQVSAAWHSCQEHPTIVGMALAVSSCLSLLEDRCRSETQQMSPFVKEERTQGEPQRLFSSNETQSSKSRVQPVKNTCEASLQSSITKIKPQRKRTWDTSTASHSDVRTQMADSPEKKRMKMNQEGVAPTQAELSQNPKEPPTEVTSSSAEVKPQRKRMWDTFVASHSDVGIKVADSPEKKRMKMDLNESVPTHTGKGSNSSAEAGPSKCPKKRRSSEGDGSEKPQRTTPEADQDSG